MTSSSSPTSGRLVFFGSGAFGLPTLRALSSTHEIAAVITQPDKPAGRGGRLTPTPIGAWAAENLPSTPLLKPADVNEPSTLATIRAIPADTFVVIAFGQKLSPPLLADRFAINLHASLLPRWRGAAPINAAILAGDPHTGNSVITLADRMDAGLILAQSRRPIEPLITAGELHDLLSEDGPPLVQSVLAQRDRGDLAPRTQDPALVTKARKLAKEDGALDFQLDADECRRRIHGLNPWPTVTVTFRSEPLKLLRARVAPAPNAGPTGPTGPAGEILDPAAGLIACGRGTILQLIEVQPAGRRPMTWQEFANGKRPTAGERLTGGPAT